MHASRKRRPPIGEPARHDRDRQRDESHPDPGRDRRGTSSLQHHRQCGPDIGLGEQQPAHARGDRRGDEQCVPRPAVVLRNAPERKRRSGAQLRRETMKASHALEPPMKIGRATASGIHASGVTANSAVSG